MGALQCTVENGENDRIKADWMVSSCQFGKLAGKFSSDQTPDRGAPTIAAQVRNLSIIQVAPPCLIWAPGPKHALGNVNQTHTEIVDRRGEAWRTD